MIVLHDRSDEDHDIRPPLVLKKAQAQLRSTSALKDWFNTLLKEQGKQITDILDGELTCNVYICTRGSSMVQGQGQTRWEGVFKGRWPDLPDRSIGLSDRLFDATYLRTDNGDAQAAATTLIHELAHWVEAYSLGRIWPGDRKGAYDTGDYVETLISW